MPQAILPRPVDKSCPEDERKQQLQVQEYHRNDEVDCVSISSSTHVCQDGDDCDDYDGEYENAIVVNDQPHLPHFGTVSVVNSNDVHFGNKTVYKGPVTIKQFVYPQTKSELNGDVIGGLSSLNGTTKEWNGVNCVNKETKSQNGGVLNGGFVAEENRTVIGNKPQEGEQETIDFTERILKGVTWLKAIPSRNPKRTMILLFLVVISVTSLSAVLIWTKPTKVIRIAGSDYEEKDNNGPIDYSSDAGVSPINKLRVVTRRLWLAQPPAGKVENLTLPVSLVVIQHTATTQCISQAQCVVQTRDIQTFHIEGRNWSDIAYNFLIGGDGAVYEGRGWTKVGAHTYGVNTKSIGVAFIGTFNTEVPPPKMLNTFWKLMDEGTKEKYLTEDYKIKTARQFSGTESPGKTFFELIKTWSQFSST